MHEIICYDIVRINQKQLSLICKDMNINIQLNECASNYAREKILQESNCVAERDITDLSFVFYTIPKTKIVFKKSFLKIQFHRCNVYRFLKLQKMIDRCGYNSFDLS